MICNHGASASDPLTSRHTAACQPPTDSTQMPPAALDSPAEMLLTANSVGLGQPADELGVDVGRRCEPESMHHIARRQYLYVQEPRAVDTTGQHQVPAQPSATRHEGREAHPHVQGYARFLWQNFHWSER